MRVSALLLVSLFCRLAPPLPPPPPPECPIVGVHHLPHPSHCDGYYSCSEGVRSYRVCPDGLLYNRATPPDGDPCDDPAYTTCYTAPPSEPQCLAFVVFHLPDPSRCDGYYNCTDGVSSFHVCPDGLLYNRATPPGDYPCDDPANTTCYTATPPSPPPSPLPVCPGGNQRHLPDPDDCSAFYECRFGAAYPRKCPEELLYNAFSPPTRFPCDYPDNVDCGASPPPPPPSQDRKRDKATKVYNFYKYVTNNW